MAQLTNKPTVHLGRSDFESAFDNLHLRTWLELSRIVILHACDLHFPARIGGLHL